MGNYMARSNNSEPEKGWFSGKSITKKAYLVGLLVIFATSYGQYLITGLNVISGTLIVYGIPILITVLLWGSAILHKALKNTYNALKFGIGFFGVFSVLGTFAATVLFYVLATLDPATVNLLQRPNPVLNVSPELAWIMVGFSLVVVGPAEEYLFRGFIYGGLLSLFRGHHWLTLAFISSILFAGVHLYYAIVYGVASLIPFVDIVTFGMAVACTYYLSGGNLLVPALIHGAYDATGFIGVATSETIGLQLRGVMIFLGIIVAIIIFAKRKLK
jgi:membrane protease YdiL (CAAX protease family)